MKSNIPRIDPAGTDQETEVELLTIIQNLKKIHLILFSFLILRCEHENQRVYQKNGITKYLHTLYPQKKKLNN